MPPGDRSSRSWVVDTCLLRDFVKNSKTNLMVFLGSRGRTGKQSLKYGEDPLGDAAGHAYLRTIGIRYGA